MNLKDLPKTRAEALATGAKYYFTGKPCKRGHVSKRTASCSKCLACATEYDKSYYEANKEAHREGGKRYREANRDRVREAWKRYREANQERQKAYLKRWYEKNKEKHCEGGKRYREENRKRLLEAQKRYREANAKQCRDTEKRWREANPDKSREHKKRYREANPKACRESLKKWRKANPEHYGAFKHNRRAREAGAEGSFTKKDILEIRVKQGGVCATPGCGCREKLTIDHIVPLVKGGSNWPDNLQLLCGSCNSRKHARDNDEFMEEARRANAKTE